MYIRLSLAPNVEYSYIEKFRRTFKKQTVNAVLEFADLDPESTLLSVSGFDKDEFGNGLRNISVIAKGTRKGTVTSENGKFIWYFQYP